MWRRVEVKNYRSIEHVTVDLAPFTVVVGPNGSGKSNFADALVFARDVGVDASSAVERRAGISGVRRWRPRKPTDVVIDVRAAASQSDLDSNYVRHQFTIHSGSEGSWSFSRELIEDVGTSTPFRVERKNGSLSYSERTDGVWHAPGHGLAIGEGARAALINETASGMVLARQLAGFARGAALRNVRRVRLNPEVMRQPQAATESTRLEESGQNLAVAYRSLKSKALVVAAMQKIVPGLQDISVEGFDRFLLLKFTQGSAGSPAATFSATEMSEGALRALGILVAAHQMRADELLVIEEPEVSIHVGAAQLLFDVLKQASEKGSVLLTTHSADLLDAARDEEILVCEYRDGVTRMGPLSMRQRQAVRDGLFSVAELMRSEPLRIEGPAKRRRNA